MKKVFLLFGIAAFTSASAQQKDVFDIQKHLDKIVKDKKFPRAVTGPSVKSTDLIDHRFFSYERKPFYTLHNGDKVYVLSGDNMPCVVPDMSQFTIMPNISDPNQYFNSPLFKNNTPGTIPNAVKPYRLIIASK